METKLMNIKIGKIVDTSTISFPMEDRVVSFIRSKPAIAHKLCMKLSDDLRDEVLNTETELTVMFKHYDALLTETSTKLSENDVALSDDEAVEIIIKLLIVR